jgi:transcriptional regulator with XRE-family HTH domain
MGRKSPQAVDRIVGRNVRLRRLAKGISQTELGEKIGVTFQQVQKYEKGVNRVSSGRLSSIAKVLETSVSALFDHGPEHVRQGREDDNSPLELLSEPQALRVVRAFSKIGDPSVRRSVVSLVENLAREHKRD